MKTGWFDCTQPIPDKNSGWKYKEGQYSIDILNENSQGNIGIFFKESKGMQCAIAPFSSFKKAFECLKGLFQNVIQIKD
jgi:hypothetical protein